MPSTDQSAKFINRTQAGKVLAGQLEKYARESLVVLALPRGGVPVGFEVAVKLEVPLDVIVARKLGSPKNPELGIGAVAEERVLILDKKVIEFLQISENDLDREIHKEEAELWRQIELFRGDGPLPDVEGKTVILVDDGLATGATAKAAIEAIRKKNPQRVIFASPVCAASGAAALREEADEVICISEPIDFGAVGEWYHEFGQTPDEEVVRLINDSRRLAKRLRER